MARKKRLDVDDACSFPPGVELPSKGRLSAISGSIFADPRFVGSALLVAGMIFILGLTLVPPPIIKIAGEPSIWNATIPNWGGGPVFDTKLKWVPRYSNITTLKGEMILSGEQELKLENGSYSIDGTILVKDKAKLIMRNADISIKYKTGYSGIDQIQTYLNIKLVDEASLEATNSTIFYPQNTASFGFYNNSQCIITNCNMSRVDITGYSESRLELKGSKVNFLGIGENTQLSLNLCSVYGVYPATYALEGFNGGVALKTGKLVLDASDSNITQVSTFYRNSTITVDHSINGYHEKWSSWDIAEGGDGFEISLVRCNVSNIVVCVEGGEAEVSNVHDLYGLEVLWSKVRVVNSTLPWVAAGGGGVIEGCVIGVFDVIDGNYSFCIA
ncbi:MAG: hypothetical protein NTY03_04415 [Candidatus Bathyarchaeota archaeon]|nr:hypothetical protein [Candidatus Bathyarchaeota archaeon]